VVESHYLPMKNILEIRVLVSSLVAVIWILFAVFVIRDESMRWHQRSLKNRKRNSSPRSLISWSILVAVILAGTTYVLYPFVFDILKGMPDIPFTPL
jgi:hypothetical protein